MLNRGVPQNFGCLSEYLLTMPFMKAMNECDIFVEGNENDRGVKWLADEVGGIDLHCPERWVL